MLKNCSNIDGLCDEDNRRCVSGDNILEVTEEDTHQIASEIIAGMTSGILDSDGYRITWELKVDKFKN